MLTQDELKDRLHYEPDTGLFTWRHTTGSKSKAGRVAGGYDTQGYVLVGMGRRLYRAHRLAWLYVYGVWPNHTIDHINRVRHDNRIINLRMATQAQNCQNMSARVTNTSGFVGISQRSSGRWSARIRCNYKYIYIGTYDTPEEAYQAYQKAAAKYHTHNPYAVEA